MRKSVCVCVTILVCCTSLSHPLVSYNPQSSKASSLGLEGRWSLAKGDNQSSFQKWPPDHPSIYPQESKTRHAGVGVCVWRAS